VPRLNVHREGAHALAATLIMSYQSSDRQTDTRALSAS
jgi:hypothetical protein